MRMDHESGTVIKPHFCAPQKKGKGGRRRKGREEESG
jgi:hypothetical protein